MPHGIKLHNSYAGLFGELYDRTPKAVFAAVLASLLSCGGDRPEDVQPGLLEEWGILHANKIVPQLPPKGEQS